MLSLADYWIWDSWIADVGDTFHLYFLQAWRSFKVSRKKAHAAQLGHATSADLKSWTYQGIALGPGPALARRVPGTIWRCGPDRPCWAMTACGGCTTRRSPAPAVAFSTSALVWPNPTTWPAGAGWGTDSAGGRSTVVHDAGTRGGPGRQRDLAGSVRVPRSRWRRLAHVHHRAPQASAAPRQRGDRPCAWRRDGALGSRATALTAGRFRVDRGTPGADGAGLADAGVHLSHRRTDRLAESTIGAVLHLVGARRFSGRALGYQQGPALVAEPDLFAAPVV